MGLTTFTSHPSLRVRMLGVLLEGVKEVTHTVTVERVPVYAAGKRGPIGYTKGKVTYACSITLLRECYEKQFKPRAKALGKKTLDADGVMTLYTQEPGAPASNVEVRFAGFTNRDGGSSEGSDPHEVKLDLAPTAILEDGSLLIDERP